MLLSPYIDYFFVRFFFTSCYFGIVSFSGFLGMSMVGKKHVKSQIMLLISPHTGSLLVINEVTRKK